MQRRTLAVLVTVALTLSMLWAMAPIASHGASTSPYRSSPLEAGAIQPAATSFTVLNGYDQPTTTFYPGAGASGQVYFAIYDTADQAVNVTISDANAARDGVASPAYQYLAVLNSTTFSFNSYTAHVYYAFPANLPYGGTWTVDFSAPNAGSNLYNITTRVYSASVATSVGYGATLPGEGITVFWQLNTNSNGGLYTHATNVELVGQCTGNGTYQTLFPLGPAILTSAGTGQGQWSGVVPANATPNTDLYFELYAVTNVSGTVAENETASTAIAVGALAIGQVGLAASAVSCPTGDFGLFSQGAPLLACLEAGSVYYGGFTPIAGLPVTVSYWNGSATVFLPGGATSATTNAYGYAEIAFPALAPPFVTDTQTVALNSVNLSVSVPGADSPYTWTEWFNQTFAIIPGTTGAQSVTVTLDSAQYYVGDTATATWSTYTSDPAQSGLLNGSSWYVESGYAGQVFDIGAMTGGTQSGTFSFPITSAMLTIPYLVVIVVATNATTSFEGYATVYVLAATLALSPSSPYYNPGSTVSVGVSLLGGGSSAVIHYQVTGSWSSGSAVLSNGTVANGGTVSVAIPSTAPPQYVTVFAWATVSGQQIAAQAATVDLAVGYSLTLSVATASSYNDGSYQPGQTVSLSYQVTATNGVPLPKQVSLELATIGAPAPQYYNSVAPSGSIPFVIPSNAPQGTLIIEALLTGLPPGTSCLSCIALTGLQVNPHPSVLNYDLGAGSGVTVGWVILLVLIVLLAVVLVIMMLRQRGGRFRAGSTGSTSSATEWTPPTNSSSEGSAPTGSGESPPPSSSDGPS